MKIKEGFMLRDIAGTWIIVPIGKRVVEFNGLMTLSDSGAFLWRNLENNVDIKDLISSLLNEYDIDELTAKADVEEFIASIHEKGLIEE